MTQDKELDAMRDKFMKKFRLDDSSVYELPEFETGVLNRLKFEYDKLHDYWYDENTIWPDDFDPDDYLGEMNDIIYLYQSPPVDLLITEENISNFHNNKVREFARCMNKLKKFNN
jgi:hypothetical protein